MKWKRDPRGKRLRYVSGKVKIVRVHVGLWFAFDEKDELVMRSARHCTTRTGTLAQMKKFMERREAKVRRL